MALVLVHDVQVAAGGGCRVGAARRGQRAILRCLHRNAAVLPVQEAWLLLLLLGAEPGLVRVGDAAFELGRAAACEQGAQGAPL